MRPSRRGSFRHGSRESPGRDLPGRDDDLVGPLARRERGEDFARGRIDEGGRVVRLVEDEERPRRERGPSQEKEGEEDRVHRSSSGRTAPVGPPEATLAKRAISVEAEPQAPGVPEEPRREEDAPDGRADEERGGREAVEDDEREKETEEHRRAVVEVDRADEVAGLGVRDEAAGLARRRGPQDPAEQPAAAAARAAEREGAPQDRR